MKILQFSDSFLPIVDGVGNVVYQYAEYFGKKGHESYVVAPMTDTGYRGNYNFEMIDYIGISPRKLKTYTVGLPDLDANCRTRLSMVKADIVHVHDPFIAGNAGLAYARRKKVPVIGTFHSKYYDDFLKATGNEIAATIGTKGVVDFYKRCDEVWTVSKSAAETLHEYGYKKEIKVIPNGTDIFPLDKKKYDETALEYSDSKAPILLYVGQINRKKNIEMILKALSKLSCNFSFILAGMGPDRDYLEGTASSLGIKDKTVFAGHVGNRAKLNSLYALADLFVFPSEYDTSGLVIREAAAMGTPCITLRGSAAGENITDGENGFLCNNDPDDLAGIIQRIINDKALLCKVGEKAKETLPIPWDKITDTVLERYDEVIAKDKAIREARAVKRKK